MSDYSPPPDALAEASGDRCILEALAAELGTEDWVLAAVRTHRHWGIGHEVGREDFKAACLEVKGLRVGIADEHAHPVK